MRRQRRTLIIVIFIIGYLLAACSRAGSGDAQDDPADATASDPAAGGGAITATATLQATSTPTNVPATATPDIPEGWEEVNRPAAGINFAKPPGWEVAASEGGSLTLYEREDPGTGWLEINVVTDANEAQWGIDVRADTQPAALMDAYLTALNEDGSFAGHEPLLTRDGRTARVATGIYDLLDEQLLLAILTQPERALLVVGHGPAPGEEDEWQRLQSVYMDIVRSIRVGDP